jgi:HSP20 family protein
MSRLDTIRVAFRGDREEEPVPDPQHDWAMSHREEGQLAVDVFETETDLFVVSTVAGVKPSSLDVSLHNELLTIRGERQSPLALGARPMYSECFWGPFSRTIVLPADVRGDKAKANYKHGVLTLRIPKRQSHGTIPVEIVDE